MTLPTQNPVPSSAKNDQLFNAEKIDQVVNSDDLQYTDRFGKKRFTFSGLYDIIQKWINSLKGSAGASNIGTSDGTSVQDQLDSIPRNPLHAGIDESVINTMRIKGGYDITPSPQEIQGVAGLTFGGKNNSFAIVGDNRGRLSGSSLVDGKWTAIDVHYPFQEGTGYFRGRFQDVIARFPVSGMADDDTTHGLIFSYDPIKDKPILAVVSPGQYDKEGLVNWDTTYAYGTPIHHQVRELAQVNDIGRSLTNSFDTWFRFNNPGIRFYKIASITNPNNIQNAGFSGIITIGNWGNYSQRMYALNVNAQNAASQTNSLGMVQNWVQFTCMHGRKDNRVVNTGNTPRVGVVQNKATGVLDIWLSIPTNSKFLSCNILNQGDPSVITFDWSGLNTMYKDISSTEPVGIVYAPTSWPYTTTDTVMTNGGEVVATMGGGVLRIGNSNIFTQRGEILGTPFVKGGSLFAHSNANELLNNVTVTQSETFVYTVSGVNIRWDTFRVKPPADLYEIGKFIFKLVSQDTTAKTFSFTIHTKTYTLGSDQTITQGLSSPIMIPDYTWVDISVQW